MRLFAAVTPPAPVLDRVAEMIASVRDGVSGQRAVRWAGRAQWHITLAFYGEMAPERLPALAARLAGAAADTPPIELSVTGGGAFPDAGHARVLWAGVGGDLPGLRRLADAVAAAGRDEGAEPDRKAYRPHLTLARCRTPTDLRRTVTDLAEAHAGSWAAQELLLIRSHPGPRPAYETVGAWPLSAARGSPQ